MTRFIRYHAPRALVLRHVTKPERVTEEMDAVELAKLVEQNKETRDETR